MTLSDQLLNSKKSKQVEEELAPKKINTQLKSNKMKTKINLNQRDKGSVKGMFSAKAGELKLDAGESIETKSRILIMQGDGNLVLYKKDRGAQSKPLWSSRTNTGSNYRAVFQGDGNLVIYNAKGEAKWASGTNPQGNRLIIQNDGNLVIYSDVGNALWATATN